MTPATKTKSLTAIIIFLLLSNISMLIFFLVLGNTNKTHAHKDIIANFLKSEIGFDKIQMDDYEKMHQEHWDSMRLFFDDIKKTKDSFYNFLYTKVPDSTVNNAAAVIGFKQKTLDLQMFQYLKKVRNLCKGEQLGRFDSLFNSVLTKMTGRARKGGSKTN